MFRGPKEQVRVAYSFGGRVFLTYVQDDKLACQPLELALDGRIDVLVK